MQIGTLKQYEIKNNTICGKTFMKYNVVSWNTIILSQICILQLIRDRSKTPILIKNALFNFKK
jgi:hypothetical protein